MLPPSLMVFSSWSVREAQIIFFNKTFFADAVSDIADAESVDDRLAAADSLPTAIHPHFVVVSKF